MAHQSAYASLTELCEALVHGCIVSNNLERSERHRFVRKLRTNAFEILLNKHAVASSPTGLPVKNINALVKLRFHTFALHQEKLQQQADKLHSCIDRIMDIGLARDESFMAALQFLLCYAENNVEELPITQNIFQDHLDYFKLPFNNSYTNVRPYSEFSPDIFNLPKCLLEQTTRPSRNTYQFLRSTSFPFSKEPGSDLPLLSRFIRKPKMDSIRCAMQSTFGNVFTIADLSSPRSLIIPKLEPTAEKLLKDEGYGTPSQEFADMDPGCRVAAGSPADDKMWDWMHCVTWSDLRTWESLGETCPDKELGFLHEVSPGDMRHVCLVQALGQMHSGGHAASLDLPSYRPRSEILLHLKYLAAGIESTTFFYNQDMQVFEKEPGVCMEGMAPRTFSLLCEDFLTCGTYCRRIHNLVCGEPTQGLVYQAACRSARAYLALYRHTVLSTQTGSLARLHGVLSERAVQLACLSDVLFAGLGGGRLIVGLCGRLRAVSRPDLVCLLCSLLLACCRTYFSFLEEWIFKGACKDVHGEFFIQVVAEFQDSHGRSYWNRGFLMDESEVPSFMHGLEATILQCAKTVALLKLCNPKDPLCTLSERQHPRMSCCMTEASLAHLEEQFRLHEVSCRQLCPEPVSVSQLLQRTNLDLHAIQEARSNKLLSLQREREVQAAEVRARKQRVLAEQMEQAEIARAKKQAQAELNLLEGRQQLALEQLEEQRLLQLERESLVQYYGLLSESAEKKIKDAEIRIDKALESRDYARQLLNSNSNIVLPSPNNNSQESVLNIANIAHTASTEDTAATEYVSNCVITTPNGNVHFPDVNSNDMAIRQPTQDMDNYSGGVDLICHKLDVCNQPHNINSVVGGHTPESTNRRTVPHSLPLNRVSLAELTEAQRNKHKVLYEEFGMAGAKTKTGVVKNSLATPNMEPGGTDLERNRNRVLQSNIDIGLYRKEWPDSLHPVIGGFKNISPTLHLQEDSSASSVVTTHCVNADVVSAPHQDTDGVSNKLSSSNGLQENENDLSSQCIIPDERIIKEPDTVEDSDPLSERVYSCSQVVPFSEVVPDDGKEVLLGKPCFEDMCEIVDIADKLGSSVRSVCEEVDPGSVDMFFVQSALRRSVLVPVRIQARLANAQILHHLLVECGLLSHLQSLRNFYFLLDGEFARTVTCDLFERMYHARRPCDLLNFATLSTVLSRAIAASSTANNGQHLSFRITSVPEIFKHASPSVLGNLSLHYHVSWPLNIIITDSSLEKYNTVFGLLLKLRRIWWVMEQDLLWLKGVVRKRGHTVDRDALLKSPQYHKLQLWRHDMVHVMAALHGYLLASIQHNCWPQFQHSLQSARNLDDICRAHSLYVRDVLHRCFLDTKSQPMETALQNLCRVILKFHGVLHGKHWVRRPGDNCYSHPAFDRLNSTYKSFRHLCSYLYRLSVKIATRGYQTHIFSLLQLLNMNGYYGDQAQAQLTDNLFHLHYVYGLSQMNLGISQLLV